MFALVVFLDDSVEVAAGQFCKMALYVFVIYSDSVPTMAHCAEREPLHQFYTPVPKGSDGELGKPLTTAGHTQSQSALLQSVYMHSKPISCG